MADSVLDEVALRAARQRYMIDATRMEQEAKKLEMAEYPLTARIWRNRAKIASRAAAAELIDPEPK
jgi:hypothetical protein